MHQIDRISIKYDDFAKIPTRHCHSIELKVGITSKNYLVTTYKYLLVLYNFNSLNIKPFLRNMNRTNQNCYINGNNRNNNSFNSKFNAIIRNI